MAKISSEGISENVITQVLQFLNTAKTPEDIAGIEPQDGPVYDDPTIGYGQPGYDIGALVGERILAKRRDLGGKFTRLEELSGIPGFGQDKFQDLVRGFGLPPPAVFDGIFALRNVQELALREEDDARLHRYLRYATYRRYGHGFEVALVLGVDPSYPPVADEKQAPPLTEHALPLMKALHEFYDAANLPAKTAEQVASRARKRSDAIEKIKTAEGGKEAAETLKARIVDLALRLEETTDTQERSKILGELAALVESREAPFVPSAVEHTKVAEALSRFRRERRDLIDDAHQEAAAALKSYRKATGHNARTKALAGLGDAAARLDGIKEVDGAVNVLAGIRDLAQAHDTVLGLQQALPPADAAAALVKLRNLADAHANEPAKRALGGLFPNPQAAERTLLGLQSEDPAVSDQAFRDLHRLVSARELSEELDRMASSALADVRKDGYEIRNLLEQERVLVRQLTLKNQRAIEDAYERFLREPSAEILKSLEGLVRERQENFRLQDLDFALRDACWIEALGRMERAATDADAQRALQNLEALVKSDYRVEQMLKVLGENPAARAGLSGAALLAGRSRLPLAEALIGERRGLVTLARLGPASASQDFELAANLLRAAVSINETARDWEPWARTTSIWPESARTSKRTPSPGRVASATRSVSCKSSRAQIRMRNQASLAFWSIAPSATAVRSSRAGFPDRCASSKIKSPS